MLSTKTYIRITGVVVFIVGFIHLLRIFGGWVVVVNGWTIPMWVSIVGFLATWYLAYNAYILTKKIKK